METFQIVTQYIFCFVALYIEVFFLINAFGGRKEIKAGTVIPDGIDWPAVTIVVPCWNEEDTVVDTITSLLEIDYPEDKLHIIAVDDGSTDETWARMQQFKGKNNIEIFTKENGGKHTAMNLAIKMCKTEFVGCLDADAFIAYETLKKTMYQFIADPQIMAVSPTIIVHNPKGFLQKAQDIEYNMFILNKKVLAMLNGLHVTQGPFSMYRTRVFTELGPYRKAHNTEDLEIAYRMQAHGYKIGQCHDAYVYTVTPDTVKTLYKQRLRWVYGFLNNSFDYRKYIMRPKYGTFSVFSIPIGFVSIFGTLFTAFFLLWSVGVWMYHGIERLIVTNFHMAHVTTHFGDPFYFDTRPISLVSLFLFLVFLIMAVVGQRMAGKKSTSAYSFVVYVIIFSIISPFWFFRAVYNSLVTREMSWR